MYLHICVSAHILLQTLGSCCGMCEITDFSVHCSLVLVFVGASHKNSHKHEVRMLMVTVCCGQHCFHILPFTFNHYVVSLLIYLDHLNLLSLEHEASVLFNKVDIS